MPNLFTDQHEILVQQVYLILAFEYFIMFDRLLDGFWIRFLVASIVMIKIISKLEEHQFECRIHVMFTFERFNTMPMKYGIIICLVEYIVCTRPDEYVCYEVKSNENKSSWSLNIENVSVIYIPL